MSLVIRFYTPEPKATGVYLMRDGGHVVITLVHRRRGHLDYWLAETSRHLSWESVCKRYDGAELAYVGNPFEEKQTKHTDAGPSPWEQPSIETEEA